MWVLTGDKVETAINIAYSTKLFDSSMTLFTIKNDQVKQTLFKIANKLEKTSKIGIVIRGDVFGDISQSENMIKKFIEISVKCESVLFC